ncbi:MAG: hypothetical protein PHF67_05250 [Candidatus Nanoarchaeia archaeon]|nr:hypothetical protein [Candidatus Nanoarchaeia archaeon]
MNEKFYGNYLGIVICNSDPLKKGRVQIYVPYIYAVDDSIWDPREIDSYFSFPMENNSDKTKPLNSDILEYLKKILPWSEPALPIAAGNSTGRYNAFTKTATTSDTNLWTSEGGKYKIVYGPRPSQQFRKKDDSISDAFNKQNGLVPSNPYSFEYNPPDYSNTARGMFSVPNVGAHLWIFFKEGNHMCPIYFASCAGGEDFNGIYEYTIDGKKVSVDYPSNYENNSSPNNALTSDAQTFRSKTVLNSNKNTIELIDTDLREILRLTHYSGSFKEFNNLTNIELATKNDQKLVLGDQYQTINGNRGLFVGKNQDMFIVGDNVKQIGKKPDSIIVKTMEDIYKIVSELHNYNRLFDLQRCNPTLAPKEISPYQTQVPLLPPGYSICPVCNAISYDSAAKIIENWTFYSWIPSSARGQLGLEWQMLYLDVNTYKNLLASELQTLVGVVGIKFGERCSTCSTLKSNFIPTGLSPSTESGSWVPEPKKEINNFAQVLLAAQKALAPLTASLGKGDEIVNVNQNKIETIGLKMNDLKPYRIDPEGKLRIRGITIAPGGVYDSFKSFPLVESVDVVDLPGDYNLTACNKYKLLVGAKGVDIKTFGPFNVIGSIINFSGEQINFTSNNEINIDGGKRLSLRAEHISLHPYEHDPVVIDAPLHVSRNITTKGGLYVEGELGIQHITAPSELQETLWMGGMGTNGWSSETEDSTSEETGVLSEKTLYKTDSIPYDGATLEAGNIIPGIPVEIAPHSHIIPPHTHMFFNIPISFCFSKEQVRALMAQKGINSQVITVAANQVGGLETVFSNNSPEATTAIFTFINKCDSVIRDVFYNLNKSINIVYSLNSVAMNTQNAVIKSDVSSGTGTLFGQILYQMDYRINPKDGEETAYTNTFKVQGEVFLRKSDNINEIQVAIATDNAGENEQSITKNYGVSTSDIEAKIKA